MTEQPRLTPLHEDYFKPRGGGMETTFEQRQAVRRDECRSSGHSFVETVSFGSMAPISVICSNCGSSWRIHPDDAGKDFTFSKDKLHG